MSTPEHPPGSREGIAQGRDTENILLVSENWRVFGAPRETLFAAMQRQGWRQAGDRWFAPRDGDAETAFNQLLQAVRPVEGLTTANLQDVMLGQDPEMNDVWREALSLVGPYPVLRAEPGRAPGLWRYYPAHQPAGKAKPR